MEAVDITSLARGARSAGRGNQSSSLPEVRQTPASPAYGAQTLTAWEDVGRENQGLNLARRIVRPGGSGDAQDAEVVARELARLPFWVLERSEAAGLNVVACRNSVTDYLEHLQGQRPRGWREGRTFDEVPGVEAVNMPGKPIVIATIDGPDGRQIPPKGHGHGSEHMVFHEFGHGVDSRNALGIESQSPEFLAAYEADIPSLRAQNKDYLLQPAPAGPNEAFADMFDWYTGGVPDADKWGPNMYRLFAQTEARITRSAS